MTFELKGMSMTDLSGKVVMITGASRGIGAAAARAYVAAGAKVCLLARSLDDLSDLATELGQDALAIPCDVSRYLEVAAAVDACVQTFSRLDILVNNAGAIEPIAHLAEADPEAWGHVIDINLKGVFYGMRAAMPVMIAQGGGSILTISSGAAHNALEGWSQYCASKAGAAMLTMCADKEGRAHGIRAIGLSPGTVATKMQEEIKQSGMNPVSQMDWSAHIPADWPAQALVWMSGPEADDLIGTEISLRDDVIRHRIGLPA
jgi:NAD(P)-dependent dehydrogenase (short-subunit alcohol dehydrogenase family)